MKLFLILVFLIPLFSYSQDTVIDEPYLLTLFQKQCDNEDIKKKADLPYKTANEIVYKTMYFCKNVSLEFITREDKRFLWEESKIHYIKIYHEKEVLGSYIVKNEKQNNKITFAISRLYHKYNPVITEVDINNKKLLELIK